MALLADRNTPMRPHSRETNRATVVRVLWLVAWVNLVTLSLNAQYLVATEPGSIEPESIRRGDDQVEKMDLREQIEQQSSVVAERTGWLTDFAEARKIARKNKQPILVVIGADYCPWCKKLDAELAKPGLKPTLANWTKLYLDITVDSESASQLRVGPIPAIRLISVRGEYVDGEDGFLTEKELATLLDSSLDRGSAKVESVLLSKEKPTLLQTIRLVRQFGDRDPVIRAAAVSRLRNFPNVTAKPVIKSLMEGTLLSQLTAIELLEQWAAPVEELDPWERASLTDARFSALEQWASELPEFVAAPQEDDVGAEVAQAIGDEIDQMLNAATDEVVVHRERLARHGAQARPFVLERLATAESDQDRTRLLALRYRLVCDYALVLNWPNGLERLADRNPQVRQDAASELDSLGSLNSQALLLELFADPDPLIREISLRTLPSVGGKAAKEAFVRLLKDPEPNVRAAVLKLFAEKSKENPSFAVSQAKVVVAYVKTETDPALLVHAIRFLRSVKSDLAMESLLELSGHDSWQVRAEATEGLAKNMGNSGFANQAFGSEQLPDVYDVLLERLGIEEDAFVVSRLLDALTEVNAERAVAPLLVAAQTHDALAPRIVGMLAAGHRMRKRALPKLELFANHADPEIRVAAIKGLVACKHNHLGTFLLSATQDKEPKVRIAAANGVREFFERIDTQNSSKRSGVFDATSILDFPVVTDSRTAQSATQPAGDDAESDIESAGESNANVEPSTNSGSEKNPSTQRESDDDGKTVPDAAEDSNAEEANDGDDAETQPTNGNEPSENASEDRTLQGERDRWLASLQRGAARPPWADSMIKPLTRMLTDGGDTEQLAAASALVPLGQSAIALPRLKELAAKGRSNRDQVAKSIPWLLWEDRQDLFQCLAKLLPENESVVDLISNLTPNDFRNADLIWELIDLHPIGSDGASVQHALLLSYTGSSYFNPSSITLRKRKRIAEHLLDHVGEGAAKKRLVAITLLGKFDFKAAAKAITDLLEDQHTDPAAKADAFQWLLVSKNNVDATKLAIATLTSGSSHEQQIALQFLAFGSESLSVLTYSGLDTDTTNYDDVQSGRPIVPTAPTGLKAADVHPLVASANPKISAYAGYLLTLKGDPKGLPPLLEYWENGIHDDTSIDKLVYRSIASLNDSTKLDVLREIYRGLSRHEYGEFYWTIRIMSGDGVIQLRKRIRDEVGIRNLR